MSYPQYGYDYTGRQFFQPVNQMYQPAPMPAQQPVQQPVQQQIRSGGIVSVSGEDEARRYPVAPGYTVTMRDETGPYLYEKTMGFSQLDQPIFRKARIVFEDAHQPTQETAEQPAAQAVVYAELAQLEALKEALTADINDIRAALAALGKPEPASVWTKEAE